MTIMTMSTSVTRRRKVKHKMSIRRRERMKMLTKLENRLKTRLIMIRRNIMMKNTPKKWKKT